MTLLRTDRFRRIVFNGPLFPRSGLVLFLFVGPVTKSCANHKANAGKERTKWNAKSSYGSPINKWSCQFVFFCVRIHNKCVVLFERRFNYDQN